MGKHASEMTDQDIEEILWQIKKITIFIVSFMEREKE